MTRLKILVSGTNGAQGAAIAGAASQHDADVRGLGRRSPGAGGLPTLQVDLVTGGGLAQALEGVDAFVFTLPIDFAPGHLEAMAEQVIAAAKISRLKRLVVNFAGPVFAESTNPGAVAARAIRANLLASGLEVVLLEPTIYMDNIRAPWSLPGIVKEGVLAGPAPAAARISWLSHASLGAFAWAAATLPAGKVAGRIFRIGGPEALTGAEIAASLSAETGRMISYFAVPLDAFAEGLDAAFGPPAGDRVSALYRHLETVPDALALPAEDYAPLGLVPETFGAFARRHDWNAA